MNQDAKHILDAALRDALPGAAVGQALDQIVFQPGGRLILVAAGKAAWEMARAAHERLGGRIELHSAPGQGTRFVLHLPLVAPTLAAEPVGEAQA